MNIFICSIVGLTNLVCFLGDISLGGIVLSLELSSILYILELLGSVLELSHSSVLELSWFRFGTWK